MTSPKHFLTLRDLTPEQLRKLLARAIELKSNPQRDYEPLKNRVLGMVFDKSSTRTRISFETGMTHFGGHAIFLSPRDTQLGRGEPIEDTARVMSEMVDCVMLRTHSHETVETFARHSSVPVINGLTDLFHPCQLLADMQTFLELRGDIRGKTVCWVGDGNNMCHSYMEAAVMLDFQLNIACPSGYMPDESVITLAGDRVQFFETPEEAASNADLVATDVWASMGQESEQQSRMQAFRNFMVTTDTMQAASKNALFMHCLPAHRGEEVSEEVLEGPQSVVWQEAGNRLHSQKALLEFLLCSPGY